MNNAEQEADALLMNLRVLNQIGTSILSEFTVPQVIDAVYGHVNQLMDAYSFAIGIFNPSNQQIEYVGTRENYEPVPPFSVHAYDQERFSGWIFTNKKHILINDYQNEYQLYLPRAVTPLQGIVPGSCMYVPLFIGSEIIGILSLRTPVKNAYGPHSLEILKTLSVFIAKALENAGSRSSRLRPTEKIPGHYRLNPLSVRELEVLNLLGAGLSNREIGEQLFISPSTVKTHTLNIYQKLDTKNRTAAIARARKYGLLS